MRSPGFQRFVAVFAGALLALAAVFAVVTGDEGMILSALAFGALYAFYMTRFIKAEKERRANTPAKKSPLTRR
jgi:uncharacterized membrane protein (UPF0136 family)